MPTHKALYLLEKHGEFAVRDIETYKPGPGELLVEAKAIGLNPLDWKIQEVGLFVTEYPAILGYDAAGIVKEVGDGVDGFVVGDRVLWEGDFMNSSRANYQQYSIVPANLTAKLPPKLSFEQGSTIPSTYITAVFSFYSRPIEGSGIRGAQLTPFWEEGGRGKYSGQPLLVIGGASGVGQAAIQVAKLSGFNPIIATASLRNTELLKSLGATHVIDRNAPLAEAVKSITSAPIKYIYDAISIKETQEPAYQVLSPGGTFILVLPFAIDKDNVDDSKVVVATFGWPYDPDQGDLGVGAFKHLSALIESGEFKPNNVEIVPGGLAGIPKALERFKENSVSATKLVTLP
ncbi:medium-chain dehydrogenase/reductase like protein [Irpex lacteus]|nr:medium-chain dehydrogenase/reductase like protein [Irpex lacteus]